MSKPIKELIIDQYRSRFDGIENAVVVDLRGYSAKDNTQLRAHLREKNMRMTMVKNSLAKKAIAGTVLEPLGKTLVGGATFAYGADSVVTIARALVSWSRKVKELELKGAILDGTLYEGNVGVKKLSEFPTREEAQGRIVTLTLSPGGRILGIVKTLQEKLEAGETIAKLG